MATSVNTNTTAVGATNVPVATEVISGDAFQRVKIATGASGVDGGDVTAANPLPVASVSLPLPAGASTEAGLAAILTELAGKTEPADTQVVSAIALPLPTGAATSAAQTSGNASLTSIDGKLPALSGGKVPVTDPTALPLPTGAATEATLATVMGTVKPEDSASANGDPGVVILGIRRDADSTAVDNDGDYTGLKMDQFGRLKVSTLPAPITPTVLTITANAQSRSIDVSRYSNVMLMCSGAFSTVNCTFEGSLDATTDTDGVWFGIQAVRTNANTIELLTGNLSAAPTYAWEVSVNGMKRMRVRSTAWTSGTQSWTFQPGAYATEPIPAAQVSGTQPVSGTVTANIGTGALASGTNTIGQVRIAADSGQGASSTHHLISAASTNATSVKASAGTANTISCSNVNAAVRYLKLYNKASAPTVGTDTPIATILLKPGETTPVDCGAFGRRFSTGIAYAITTGIAVADTGAVSVSEHAVEMSYT